MLFTIVRLDLIALLSLYILLVAAAFVIVVVVVILLDWWIFLFSIFNTESNHMISICIT